MNDLFDVNMGTNDEVLISARELHKKLEVSKRFGIWFVNNSKMFSENEDYFRVYLKVHANRYGGTQEITDFNISIDMAKHICMMSNTEKGKECRRKLIQLEKDWNSPQKVMARALVMANKQLEETKLVLNETREKLTMAEPKVAYHDNVLNKADLIPISIIASDLGMSGKGLNKLLSEKKVIFKQCGSYKPYSNYYWLIQEGYADYQIYDRENVAPTLKWTEKGRKWIIEQVDKWQQKND